MCRSCRCVGGAERAHTTPFWGANSPNRWSSTTSQEQTIPRGRNVVLHETDRRTVVVLGRTFYKYSTTILITLSVTYLQSAYVPHGRYITPSCPLSQARNDSGHLPKPSLLSIIPSGCSSPHYQLYMPASIHGGGRMSSVFRQAGELWSQAPTGAATSMGGGRE